MKNENREQKNSDNKNIIPHHSFDSVFVLRRVSLLLPSLFFVRLLCSSAVPPCPPSIPSSLLSLLPTLRMHDVRGKLCLEPAKSIIQGAQRGDVGVGGRALLQLAVKK